LQQSGQGFNQFAQGGFQAPGIPASLGLTGQMTDPALVRAAALRANAQTAAAGIRARSDNLPTTHVADTGNPGTPVTITTSYKNKTPQQIRADIINNGLTPPPGYGLPIQPAPTGNQAAPAGGGGTQAQPQVGQPPPGSKFLSTATKEGQKAQNDAMVAVQHLKDTNNPLYKTIQLQGSTVHTIQKDPSGKLWIQGNDKRYYPMG
jgi:hypothetical protein